MGRLQQTCRGQRLPQRKPRRRAKQSNAYAVNGFRRQKTKKDGEIVTEYAEGLATAVAKAQAETITYIHGHQILGFEQGGQFYYFLTDALGSVRDIVDGTGQVVQQYQYDERGNHVIAPMSGGPASPKTFVGGLSVNDDTPDGGLYLMGHRFYDPSLGRFLNRDPIGFAGGLNLFSYGGNNPVTYTDFDGLKPEHFMDRSVGINHPRSIYPDPQPTARDLANATAIFYEPADWALTMEDISTNGLSPWHALALLPLLSYPIVASMRGLSRADDLNVVYRNLSEVDEPCNGLYARMPDAGNDAASHVNGMKKTQWISTSKTLKGAQKHTKNGFFGTVKIDLSRVPNEILDLTQGIPGRTWRKVEDYARSAQEVLIKNHVPPEAITWVQRP